MFSIQIQSEDTYSKSTIKTLITNEIKSTAETTTVFRLCEVLVESYLSQPYYESKNIRLSALGNHYIKDIVTHIFSCVLRINISEPIQGVATAIGLEFHPTSQLDAVKTGSELLAICESSGLYDILTYDDTEHSYDTAVIKPHYRLSDTTLSKIHMTQYLPPMLCAPLDWTSNSKGGLLTVKSSCILGSGNHHSLPQSLDTLNKLQSIPWKLNLDMLQEPELPKEPLDYSDPIDRRKADQHNARCKQSNQVYDYILTNGNTFYFPWKYDKRGRMYSQGYDINLQGSEYKKSILEFANEEQLTGI